jgi:hypothetical protein
VGEQFQALEAGGFSGFLGSVECSDEDVLAVVSDLRSPPTAVRVDPAYSTDAVAVRAPKVFLLLLIRRITQVLRITTPLNMADVVDLHPGGDGFASRKLICQPVRPHHPVANSDPTVTLAVDIARPQPTT